MLIAIVEDEKYFADQLSSLLNEWSKSNIELVVKAFSSGEQILEDYEKNETNYNAIFMDISMPGMNGIEVARRLRNNGCNSEVIFTTTHDEFDYARQSIGVSPLDYFIKPMSLNKVNNCMEKVMQQLSFRYKYNGADCIVSYGNIVCFESKRNNTFIHTVDANKNTPVVRIGITELEKLLPSSFLRCHRSYIINTTHITTIDRRSIYLTNRKDPILVTDIYIDALVSYLSSI